MRFCWVGVKAMEKIEGKDLMVFTRAGSGVWRAVAVSTTCTLEVTQDVREVAWRGSGPWRAYRAGWRGWSVAVDGLLPVGGDEPLNLFGLDGGELYVAFYSVAPHPGGAPPGGFVPDGRLLRSGAALLENLTEAGEDGVIGTRGLRFMGSGPLYYGVIGGDYNGDFNSDFNN